MSTPGSTLTRTLKNTIFFLITIFEIPVIFWKIFSFIFTKENQRKFISPWFSFVKNFSKENSGEKIYKCHNFFNIGPRGLKMSFFEYRFFVIFWLKKSYFKILQRKIKGNWFSPLVFLCKKFYKGNLRGKNLKVP